MRGVGKVNLLSSIGFFHSKKPNLKCIFVSCFVENNYWYLMIFCLIIYFLNVLVFNTIDRELILLCKSCRHQRKLCFQWSFKRNFWFVLMLTLSTRKYCEWLYLYFFVCLFFSAIMLHNVHVSRCFLLRRKKALVLVT